MFCFDHDTRGAAPSQTERQVKLVLCWGSSEARRNCIMGLLTCVTAQRHASLFLLRAKETPFRRPSFLESLSSSAAAPFALHLNASKSPSSTFDSLKLCLSISPFQAPQMSSKGQGSADRAEPRARASASKKSGHSKSPRRRSSVTVQSSDGTPGSVSRDVEGPPGSNSGLQKMAVAKSSLHEVGAAATLAVLLGVTNRILYKMALVPLKKYPFFLAQLTTFGYVAVYFFVLWTRIQSGIVTKAMLSIPKQRFVAMGVLEALGLASGMAAATVLPGTMITVLSQTFLAWQLLLSSLLLRKRYSLQQILGCCLVISGVIAATALSAPGSKATSLRSSQLVWAGVMVLSAAFPACSSIVKEGVFADAAKSLPGGSLDIFVVNSFGSAFQALFVFLLLPVLSRIALQVPLLELPTYFKEGAGCMLNMHGECAGAPLLPLLYIAANLAFNISVLRLLKKSSAVVTSLTMSASVPLTIAAFTLPLPFLGTQQQLGWNFFMGASLLVLGLFVYNSSSLFADRPTRED